MALVQSPSPEFSSDGPQAATPENVQKLRPHQNEGVFLLEQEPLPTFPDVGIEKTKTIRRPDLNTDDAQYYERTLLYSDGVKIPSLVGVARKPSSDIPIVTIPAWWTSIYKGFNKETADRFNAQGRHTYLHGIPTNHARSLYQNSWNVHLALDDVAGEFADVIETSVIDEEGDSNGAMTGTGVMAYGPDFGRRVRDAFLVDPCMVQKIGASEVLKFVRHPEYLAKEIYCLGKQAVRLVKDEEESALKYLGTVDFSRDYLIGNLLLARGLFWGELGHLAAHVPAEQQAQYYLFDHSIFNQKKALLEIIHGSLGNARPGIGHENHTGTHLSIANPRTLRAKVDHFAPAQ